MPLFLTLRDSEGEGNALTTAMLPPGGNDHGGFRIISVPHPMPILILSRARPSLRWQRISVSHSIATAASPTAGKEPDKYGAMSARGPSEICRFGRMSGLRHEPPLPANGTRARQQQLNQPRFQIDPIGVRVQQRLKLPPL
jgi:hypothetical protein